MVPSMARMENLADEKWFRELKGRLTVLTRCLWNEEQGEGISGSLVYFNLTCGIFTKRTVEERAHIPFPRGTTASFL